MRYLPVKTEMRKLFLSIRQRFFCSHFRYRHSSGYDLSETVCLICGLRRGAGGSDYGRDWNKIDKRGKYEIPTSVDKA